MASRKKHPLPTFEVKDTAGNSYSVLSAARSRKKGHYRLEVQLSAAPPTPPPTPPPTSGIPPCAIPPDRVGDVLKGVNSPQRLTVLNECTYAKGVVTTVGKESDGDWHIDVAADPDSPVQPQGNIPSHEKGPVVVCEIIPLDQPGGASGLDLAPPGAGDHVVLYGPNCFDQIHNWSEIHPVWRILVLT